MAAVPGMARTPGQTPSQTGTEAADPATGGFPLMPGRA